MGSLSACKAAWVQCECCSPKTPCFIQEKPGEEATVESRHVGAPVLSSLSVASSSPLGKPNILSRIARRKAHARSPPIDRVAGAETAEGSAAVQL